MSINNTLSSTFSSRLNAPLNLANQTSTPVMTAPAPLKAPFGGFTSTPSAQLSTNLSNPPAPPPAAPKVTPSTGVMSSTVVVPKTTGLLSTTPPAGSSLVPPPPQSAPQPFNTAVSGLMGIGQGTQNSETQALLTQAKAKLQEQAAENIKNINNSGADLNFKQGEASNVRLAESAKEAALGAETQGLSTVLGQQAGAFESAGSLAKPSASFPFVFNPSTGQFSNSSGGLVSATDVADAVLNKQMSYDQAKSALGYLGGTAEAQLQAAIRAKNPNANLNAIQAEGAGQSSFLQSIPTMQAANTAADGIVQTVQSYLSQNTDINPNSLAISNSLQQWLEGKQLTDPRYQTLFNYLNEYVATLAPVLGVGGSPTDFKTQLANQFVNAKASGQSISQVLANNSALAKDKIANLQSGATGGGVTNSPSGGSNDPLGIL